MAEESTRSHSAHAHPVGHHCCGPSEEPGKAQPAKAEVHSHNGDPCRDHFKGLGNQSVENIRQLRGVLVITSLYCIAEAVGGWWTGSLALLADAGHMLTDIGALVLAMFAAWLTTREHSPRKTYGYYRMEILAAFVNGLLLTLLSLWIMVEAVQRLTGAPQHVEGDVMLWVAIGGLIVNLVSVRLLHNHHDNLNLHAAYLHILGDLLGSVNTVIAAGLVLWFGWTWADPLASILISVLVMISAGRLILEAVDILLEGSPKHIDVTCVKDAMEAVDGVLSVHDLHVWTISTGIHALSAHVVGTPAALQGGSLLQSLHRVLNEQFGLSHLTIQLEPEGFEEGPVH